MYVVVYLPGGRPINLGSVIEVPRYVYVYVGTMYTDTNTNNTHMCICKVVKYLI